MSQNQYDHLNNNQLFLANRSHPLFTVMLGTKKRKNKDIQGQS